MILLGSLDVYGLFNAASSGPLGVNYPLKVTQVAVVRGWIDSSWGKIGFVDSSAYELRRELSLSFTHLAYRCLTSKETFFLKGFANFGW